MMKANGMTRKLAAAGLVSGVLLAAAAVGSAASSTHKAARKSLTTLNLAYVPYSNDSSLFLGMEKGFFAKQGIRIKPATASNPGVVIAELENGEAQLGFFTVIPAIEARAHGTLVKCVTTVDGNQGTNPAQDGTDIVVNPKSGITSVTGLQGQSVATVQIGALNTLSTDEMVYEAGGNPGKIHWVQMGFSEMPQALAQGTVPAAVATTPFSGEALAEGMRLIGHPNVAIVPNESTACFGGTDGWIAHHLKIAHAFQKAMDESIRYTPKHLNAAAATLVKYGIAKNVSEALAAKLGTNWNPKLLVSSVAKQEHLLVRFDVISASQAPKPKSVILPGT